MWLWALLPLAVAAAAASVVVSTLHLGVPPMPTSAAVRRLMLRSLGEHREGGRIVDLGSGWGGLARQAALAFPGEEVLGLEASLLPFLVSRLAAALLGPANLRFRRWNFLKRGIPAACSYLCYLSPQAMGRLGRALGGRLPPGCVLVAAVFALRGWEPAGVAEAADLYRSPVYVYRG